MTENDDWVQDAPAAAIEGSRLFGKGTEALFKVAELGVLGITREILLQEKPHNFQFENLN